MHVLQLHTYQAIIYNYDTNNNILTTPSLMEVFKKKSTLYLSLDIEYKYFLIPCHSLYQECQ